jgi:DNA-binding CsgD family transcriptional regulator
VCASGEPPETVLDVLTRLVDKSLVQVQTGATAARYRLLEPVRQYALGQLEDSGVRDTVRTAHAAHYLDLAERAAPELRGPAQVAWLDRLEGEQDNLRAALRWGQERGDAESVARLAIAVAPFWEVRGRLSEGRGWLKVALCMGRPAALGGAQTVKALIGAGRLAFWQADLEDAPALFEQSRMLASEVGETRALAESLTWLGWVRMRQCLFTSAATLLEESLPLHDALGDEPGGALGRFVLGATAWNEEDLPRAIPYLVESLRRFRALGDLRFIAMTCVVLGSTLAEAGDLARSPRLIREGLAGVRAVGDFAYTHSCLITLAFISAKAGRPLRAARLLGAAGALREALGATLAGVNRQTHDETLDGIRRHLSEPEIAVAQAAGHALTVDQALEEAAAPAPPVVSPSNPVVRTPPSAPAEPLTRREEEVARLLARGITDRQIADALGISARTVGVHVQHVIAKLGVHSRWQVADRVAAHDAGEPDHQARPPAAPAAARTTHLP